MKSAAVFSIALIISTLVFNACSKINPGEKEPTKIELNKKSLEIIEADNQFAFELFREIITLSDEDNIMISPLSVSYALGMTYNGAEGTTLDAFKDVLHLDSLTRQEVNESYQDLMGQMLTLDEDIEFTIANSIWHVNWGNVKEKFVQDNANYFDARVEALDFSDPGSVDVINDWIEEKTNDKIKDMLDFIPADAYMYLVNAIYFKATWKYEFDPEDTFSAAFTKEDGSTMTADFMALEAELNYGMTEQFTAAEFPYGDGAFSMVVLLPHEGTTADALASDLDIDAWKEAESRMAPASIKVNMPKFKYEWKDSLNQALKKLGLGVAFSDDADFSGITEEVMLFISRVLHQTFIDVNEEGTEAAAATIVEVRYESAGNLFFVDRPFLYLIKENSTGAILFMGKVGNPVHD